MFKNVHLVDPAAGRNGEFDLLIDGDRVARIGRDLPADGARVVELPSSFVVTPGLIDIHVHLREPGPGTQGNDRDRHGVGRGRRVHGRRVHAEHVPINDHASVTEFIVKRARDAGLARVYPIGAVSIGSKGEQLTEIGDLRAAGCVAITDDGRPIETALLMRRALEYASMFDMPVIDHCEDPSLKGDGVAHEGAVAALLGLRGIPGIAESIMVERDISMAELTGGRFHVAHMSARQSLRAVRDGKARGVRVTTEVTPHHFVLTDDALTERGGYDTNFKMNPPLREEADRARHDRGPARRLDRRHRDRPRAASCRREGARVRSRAVRHRGARDRGAALLRSTGPRRRDRAAAARRVAVGESGARAGRFRAARFARARPPT